MPKRGEYSEFEGGAWGRFDGLDANGEEIWTEVAPEEALGSMIDAQSPVSANQYPSGPYATSNVDARVARNSREDAAGKWQGGDRLRDVVVDAVAGLGRAGTNIATGVADTFVNSKMSPLGYLIPDEKKQAITSDINEYKTLAPNIFDEYLGANPSTATYGASQMAGQTLPYLAGATGSQAMGLAPRIYNAIRGQSGMAGSVLKYVLSRGLEGGAADAAIAAMIGDDPMVAGIGGAVGGAAAPLVFDRGGLVNAAAQGTANNVARNAIDELGSAVATQNQNRAGMSVLSEQLTLGKRGADELAKRFKDAVGFDVGTGREIGDRHTIEVEKILSNDPDVAEPFLMRDIQNQRAASGTLKEMSARQGTEDMTASAEGLAANAQSAFDTYRELYHNDIGHIADVLGLTREAQTAGSAITGERLLMETEISDAGIKAMEDAVARIRSAAGPDSADWQAIKGYYEQQLAAARGTAAKNRMGVSGGVQAGPNFGSQPDYSQPGRKLTIENLKNISTSLFDDSASTYIPNKKYRQMFRDGVNKAMAETIAEVGAAKTGSFESGKALADAWLENRRFLAEALDKWEGDALKQIRTRVDKVSAANLAKVVAKNPQWTSDIIGFIEGAGKSSEEAKRFIRKGVLENALEKSSASPGGSLFIFDSKGLRSAISETQATHGLVFPKDELDDLNRLLDVADSLQMIGKPVMEQGIKPTMRGVTEYAGPAIEQKAERGTVSAMGMLAEGKPLGALVAGASNALDRYFAKNAISRITTNREGLAELLTDPVIRDMMRQDMESVVSGLRKGTLRGSEGLMSERLQVLIKRRIGVTNPDLYKKLFSVKDAVTGAEVLRPPSRALPVLPGVMGSLGGMNE